MPRGDRPIHAKEAGLREAGIQVSTYIPGPTERGPYSQRFIDFIKSSDVVLVEYGRVVSSQQPGCYHSWPWVRQNYPGKPILLWCEEIRMAQDYPPIFMRIIKHFNELLLNHADQTTHAGYRKIGFTGPIGTMWGSADVDIADSVGDVPIEYDAVFTGNLYISRSKSTKGPAFPLSSARHAMLAELDKHFKLGIAGRGWTGFKHNVGRINDAPSLYRFLKSGKVIIGYNQFDLHRYYPERFWQALSCGRAFLTRNVSGIERDFEKGKHLVTFENGQDAISKLRELISTNRWKEVGAAGRHVMMNHHLWSHRYKNLLQHLAKLCPTLSAS